MVADARGQEIEQRHSSADEGLIVCRDDFASLVPWHANVTGWPVDVYDGGWWGGVEGWLEGKGLVVFRTTRSSGERGMSAVKNKETDVYVGADASG